MFLLRLAVDATASDIPEAPARRVRLIEEVNSLAVLKGLLAIWKASSLFCQDLVRCLTCTYAFYKASAVPPLRFPQGNRALSKTDVGKVRGNSKGGCIHVHVERFAEVRRGRLMIDNRDTSVILETEGRSVFF